KRKKKVQNTSSINPPSPSNPSSSVSTPSSSSLPPLSTNLPPPPPSHLPSSSHPPTPYSSSIKSQSYTSQKNPSVSNNIDIVSEKTTDPPYGCLKNGSKPTFREWKNKTLKNRNTESNIPIHINKSFDDNRELRVPKNVGFSERQKKLLDLQHKFQEKEKKPKKIKTRRVKRKITLGKQGKIIGVLVKSKKTRKNIKNEVTILKKKDIQEVKNYLRKHNLVKIGSSAPNDIFRSIYENAYLSGDVRNKNADILLHNWHKENEI
ncbi:MAG: hypothetical protein CL678_11700, partial [Bdellovibrionaceae bacterium]|nr:hypothetical protein [Pseudobdellovibrionaceae bacterium]